MYMQMHIYEYVRVYASSRPLHKNMHMQIPHIQTCSCAYVIHVHAYVNSHMQMCTPICTYAYAFICIYVQ